MHPSGTVGLSTPPGGPRSFTEAPGGPKPPSWAFALNRARRLLGWTQEEAAAKLEVYLGERWSKASFSAAERSVAHPERVRQFSADELVAFAATFELPVSFFFEPAPPQTTLAVKGARTIPAQDLDEFEKYGDKRVKALERDRREEWNR